MLETQVFQLLGLMYFVIALGMIINPGFYKKMLSSFSESPLATYLAGMIALTVGYLLVSFFNVWEWSWSLAITIIGWVALIKGVFIFLFPGVMIKTAQRFQKGIAGLAVIPLVIGLVLLFLGFYNF